MLGSLIATVEGGVDLVTGVWGDNTQEQRNTAGVDVRHCKGSLNLSIGFEFGRELSTVEELKTSNTFYNLSVTVVPSLELSKLHERQTEHEIWHE